MDLPDCQEHLPGQRPGAVVIDARTLADLGVLRSGASDVTVRTLVDRTRSRAGGEHLRRALMAPARTHEEITARQLAHRALAADHAAYGTLIHGIGLDLVEGYLASNWQRPRDRRGWDQLGRLQSWYPQYIGDVNAGVAAVDRLLAAAEALRTRLAATGAVLLTKASDVLQHHLETPELEALKGVTAARTRARLERFDDLARGEAKEVLSCLIDCVGAVEAMWSFGVATTEHGWTYPHISDRLSVKGLWHPFIAHSAVHSDLVLAPEVRVCFVTGPNMAGKSTFLRAVAIATLLAQCGVGVPAVEMHFVPVDVIFSSIEVTDDLSQGKSFYLSEVRRVRELALAIGQHHSALGVVDEPFRGTNVHDAAEATIAVVTRVARHPGALVFVASHVADAVPTLAQDPHVRLLHFSADLANDDPTFDYVLRDGVSTQRLGMTLLRREGVLELLDTRTAHGTADPLPGSLGDDAQKEPTGG